MIHAYSEMYLEDAKRTLAASFDAAVYIFGYKLPDYYEMFINTVFSTKFEKGDPFVVSGKSGTELAADTIEMQTGKVIDVLPVYSFDRTPEYWTGWSLAYYQWYTGCSFRLLNSEVPIQKVVDMYSKYHEMDISHFTDRINEMRTSGRLKTYLKMYRERTGYSQSELSELTGIPVRTIQQYEQGQKDINHARADYIIILSKALNVKPELLLQMT